ncbi:MAG TPA: 2,3-bisphosphoglycerate-independent phosphoglycerate mutase [Patescibacteria group bacterium]|nr:2,3-bisphosphoglycerate-independent phosphoglycerate mutase [Patescibacteria group bacterium]
MTLKKKNKRKKEMKVVLLILDGWGLGKNDRSNPIIDAKTPYINSLYQKYPWIKLCASGRCVGLPPDQVGNSEAGHINIGAGRVVDQDVIAISKQINTGEFFKNPAFLAGINHTKKNKSNLHIMGLLSNGQSPHADPDHLLALLMLARKEKVKHVYLHLFTDGRDSPPRSSLKSILALERYLKPNEVIATVMGRFYAMDRKKDWNRTEWAYEAMLSGLGHEANSPQEGITRAYNANITDEFIEPIILYHKGRMVPRIEDNDTILFFNLRSDRARQLAKPFVQKDFNQMNPKANQRKKVLKNIVFAAMTDFGPDLDGILTAFPSDNLTNTLPMMLASKKQLYVAEKEKYAHVTYFFNGGYDRPIAGEKRVLVLSPEVKSYDETPAMSTAQITRKVVSGLKTNDFICVNFACPDMVAHTGNFKAGIKAAEATDKYTKKIAQAVLRSNGVLMITADHGNLEYMLNLKTDEIITSHTNNQVPFIVISKKYAKDYKLKSGGYLGDIAPTILKLFEIDQPKEMTRKSLI